MFSCIFLAKKELKVKTRLQIADWLKTWKEGNLYVSFGHSIPGLIQDVQGVRQRIAYKLKTLLKRFVKH